MKIEINEPRKRILVDMFTHNLLLQKKRDRLIGWDYNLVKANGDISSKATGRPNKYHFTFLEKFQLLSCISEDPLEIRFKLSTRGFKLARLLRDQYAYDKVVVLEISDQRGTVQ
jgi:hypothetical protein